MNRHADLVFIRARLGFHRKRNRRLGNLRRAVIDLPCFVSQCFAGGRFLQFGDGADITGAKVADFGELLALNDLDMLELFDDVSVARQQDPDVAPGAQCAGQGR